MSLPDAHTYRLPLYSLLLRLEREGFELGTDKQLQLQLVLQELGKEYLHQPEQLKLLLSPVLARSREEQEKFYRIFDEYYREVVLPYVAASLGKKELAPEVVPPPPPMPPSALRWLLPLLLITLAAVGIGVLVYLGYRPAPELHPGFRIDTGRDTSLVRVGEPVKFINQTPELLRNDFRGTIRRNGREELVEIIWDFGDGTTLDSVLHPTHVYEEAGTFLVSMRLTTIDALSETISFDSIVSREVMVICPNQPRLGIELPQGRLHSGTKLQFVAITYPEADSLEVWWEMGDGSRLRGPVVTHTYEQEGNYLLQLRAKRRQPLAHSCSNEALFSQHIYISSPVERVALPADLLPIQDPRKTEQAVFSKRALILFVLLMLLLFALVEAVVFLRRRRRLAGDEEDITSSREGPFTLSFPDQNALVVPDAGMYALAKTLRRRREGSRLRLDIPATIRASIRNGGFLQLHYNLTSRPSEYLVLIEQRYMHSHLASLFTRVTQILKEEDVLLQSFYFDQDPRNCWNTDFPDGIGLDKLRMRFPNHRLILYTTGHFMVDPYEPQLVDWVPEQLGFWKEKLIISPVPVADWGYRERMLYGMFDLLPADLPGKLAVVDAFEQEEQADFDRYRKLMMREESVQQQSLRKYDFEQVEDLRKYLGPQLFEWLAAAVVYPQPNWEVTLAIGKALSSARYRGDDTFLLTYSNLLKLSRIPWLESGMISDSLRLELLEQLSPDTERLARKCILDLLDQLSLQEGSLAAKKLHIQQISNQFLLTPNDRLIARKMYKLWQQQQLTDKPLLRRMQQSSELMGGAKASSFLKDRFQPFKPWATLVRLMLTAFVISLGVYGMQQTDRQPQLKRWNRLLPMEQLGLIRYIPQIDSAVYYNNRGAERYLTGDSLGARHDFERAIKLRQTTETPYRLAIRNLALTYYDAGLAHYELSAYREAIREFEQAEFILARNARNTEELSRADSIKLLAWHGIGLSYYYLNLTDSARFYLDLILNTDSSFLAAYQPNLQSLLDQLAQQQTGEQLEKAFWSQWIGKYLTAYRRDKTEDWQPYEPFYLLDKKRVRMGNQTADNVNIRLLDSAYLQQLPPPGTPVLEINWRHKNGAQGLIRFMNGDDNKLYWDSQPVRERCFTGWFKPANRSSRIYLRSQRSGESFGQSQPPDYSLNRDFEFQGHWRNQNPKQKPQFVSISPGKTGYEIQMFSECKDPDCNWGRAELRMDRGGNGTAQFDLGNVTHSLRLSGTKDKNLLQIRLHSSFKDGKAARDELFYFERSTQPLDRYPQSQQQLPIQQQSPQNIPQQAPDVPKNRFLWCLDAGGSKNGSKSPPFPDGSQLEEWAYTRDVLRRVKAQLDAKGILYYDVVPDAKVGESVRARISRINAYKANVDLPKILVSVQAKIVGGTWKKLDGYSDPAIETFYLRGSRSSQQIGSIFQTFLVNYTQMPDKGVKGMDAKSALYLLQKASMPSVVLYTGGYSNLREAQRLKTERYRQAVADAIVEAIDYIEQYGYEKPPSQEEN